MSTCFLPPCLSISALSSSTSQHTTFCRAECGLEHSEQKIFSATKNQTDRFEPESIGDCLIAAFHQLEGGETSGISTGLLDLDGLMGGLIRQDLIVIAARASMGKTWLACYLANHLALEGMPVVFFSAEMSKSQLTKRFLAMHSGIDSQRLIQNKIYKSEWEVLTKAVGTIAELPIIIDDTPASAQTPSRMRSVLRRIQSERGQSVRVGGTRLHSEAREPSSRKSSTGYRLVLWSIQGYGKRV